MMNETGNNTAVTTCSIWMSCLAPMVVMILVLIEFGSVWDEEHWLGLLLGMPYLFLAFMAYKKRNHVPTSIFLLASVILTAGLVIALLIHSFFFNRGGFSGLALVSLNVILWAALIVVGIIVLGIHLYVVRRAIPS